MNRIVIAAFAMVVMTQAAGAVTATNKDAETRILVVTEGGSRIELPIATDETVEFCHDGCFVTMPNGDREALAGSEVIEIVGGRARIK